MSGLLAVGSVAVYSGATGCGFLTLDDDIYVTDNPQVWGGWNAGNLAWAFTTFHAANWHPLTWLSHMLDVGLFGPWAVGHHGVNVLLHAANTVLLFLLLRRMTGAMWRSGFTAALFGIHPLHVEPVAWVAGRKDVLSALFFLLCLLGYSWYAERPSRRRYALVAACFGLGLMSKPMLVTLPFVLLLLDCWPLGRYRGAAVRSLALEKIPLFLLSAGSCVLTYLAQRQWGAVSSLETFSLGIRLSNAVWSYGMYLWKTVWPSGLAMFYPHPGSVADSVPLAGVAGFAVLLAGVSVFAACRRGRGYLLTGWLWYLGMLVPVIGLVQVGGQSMADRYTYLPLIGIFMAVSWGVPDLLSGWRFRRAALGLCGCAVLAGLSVAAWAQVGHWQDSETLYVHALRVTRNNWLAHNNLGDLLLSRGDVIGATGHFRAALRSRPEYPEAHANLGGVLLAVGDTEGAVYHLGQAVRLKPGNPVIAAMLGIALSRKGQAR